MVLFCVFFFRSASLPHNFRARWSCAVILGRGVLVRKRSFSEMALLQHQLKDVTLTGDEQYELMWRYTNTIKHLLHLIVIVCDVSEEYPYEVRLLAGCSALRIIRSRGNGRYLDAPWFDLEHGRVAYLSTIATALPEMSAACTAVANLHLGKREKTQYHKGHGISP